MVAKSPDQNRKGELALNSCNSISSSRTNHRVPCNPCVSICVDTNPKSHNLQNEFILAVAFSSGKDGMHTAALVSFDLGHLIKNYQ